MSRKAHILNTSTGARISRELVNDALAACAAVWVVENVSIRNVTEQESIALRNRQAALNRDIAPVEIKGVRFVPSVTGLAVHERNWDLAGDARVFAKPEECRHGVLATKFCKRCRLDEIRAAVFGANVSSVWAVELRGR